MHGGVEKHLTKIALEMDDMEYLTPALELKNWHFKFIIATKCTVHERKYAPYAVKYDGICLSS